MDDVRAQQLAALADLILQRPILPQAIPGFSCYRTVEETLATVAIDLSGRYAMVFDAAFPSAKIGDFDSELVEDFWQAFAANALCNLHVVLQHGRNSHHISEAIFKGTARALRMAIEPDPRMSGVPSTKGTLSE